VTGGVELSGRGGPGRGRPGRPATDRGGTKVDGVAMCSATVSAPGSWKSRVSTVQALRTAVLPARRRSHSRCPPTGGRGGRQQRIERPGQAEEGVGGRAPARQVQRRVRAGRGRPRSAALPEPRQGYRSWGAGLWGAARGLWGVAQRGRECVDGCLGATVTAGGPHRVGLERVGGQALRGVRRGGGGRATLLRARLLGRTVAVERVSEALVGLAHTELAELSSPQGAGSAALVAP